MTTRKSHCYCGAVELEIQDEPAAQAYCHCTDCRGWLSAPLHAAALFPTPNVKVVKGGDKLAVFKKTPASERHFCTDCGSGAFVIHPQIGLTDVPAGTIEGLDFKSAMHVQYAEKVLSVKDGLPKYKDFPDTFGGSGDTLPE